MSDYINFLKVGEPGYYRIVEYIQALENIVEFGDSILELGAHVPVISDYFRREYDCKIIYSSLVNGLEGYMKKYFRKIDLCTDDIEGQWDIVTATEVIEHLPCNLYDVKDKLIGAVRDGGYLFVSAPVRGIGRGDRTLEEIIKLSDDWNPDIHLREFRNVDELKSLFCELELIDEWFSETRLRGEGSYCYNLLYRKV